MSTRNVAPLTNNEVEEDEQLVRMSTEDLLKELADLTRNERALNASLKGIKDAADILEELAIQRMNQSGTPSITVEDASGQRMKFSVSAKSYPKMVQGSRVAAQALEAYAARLYAQGDAETADALMNMLTIKGSSLQPLLNEWANNDEELPPEFTGAIEPSTRFSLSKTSPKK